MSTVYYLNSDGSLRGQDTIGDLCDDFWQLWMRILALNEQLLLERGAIQQQKILQRLKDVQQARQQHLDTCCQCRAWLAEMEDLCH